MKVVDWEAVARFLERREDIAPDDHQAVAWQQLIAKHTREVPAGLAMRLCRLNECLRGVISESAGVAGYHLNGELSAWSEFEWLKDSLDDATPEACAALDRAQAEVERLRARCEALHVALVEAHDRLSAIRHHAQDGGEDITRRLKEAR